MKNIKIAQDMLKKHNEEMTKLKKSLMVWCMICNKKILPITGTTNCTLIINEKIYNGFVHVSCKMLLPEEDYKQTWI